MRTVRFVHALPNAWLPMPGKNLVIKGVSAQRVAEKCRGREIVSHVRYEDHCAKISEELGITLKESGVNAPNPFNCDDVLIVATLSPGSQSVAYMIAYDGTDEMREAGIL